MRKEKIEILPLVFKIDAAFTFEGKAITGSNRIPAAGPVRQSIQVVRRELEFCGENEGEAFLHNIIQIGTRFFESSFSSLLFAQTST